MKNLHILSMAVLIVSTLACETPDLHSGAEPVTESEALSMEDESIIADGGEWTIEPVVIPAKLRARATAGLTQGLQPQALSVILNDTDLRDEERHPEYRVLESEQTRVMLDAAAGRIHLRAKRSFNDAGQGEGVDRELLRADALGLIEQLGADSSEFGTVEQKTLKRDSREDNDTLRSDVMAHVTFVQRAVDGVPVIGSKMVVMHDRDGQLMKVMGWWPRIEETGSRMEAELTRVEARSRIEETVRFHQDRLRVGLDEVPEYRVLTRSVLVPEENEDGTVTLNLEVEMLLDPVGLIETGEVKPLEIRVDI